MITVCRRPASTDRLLPPVYVDEFVDQLTVAMCSLHVMFHVALLGEPDAAHLTLEGLLSRVFDHVDLQGALLVEGLVALGALEGPFACIKTQIKCRLML